MDEHRSTAGQGLGIAGLILGILAIPMGIIPCTFFIGILFGIIGIVLSLVALSQANRGFGPKSLIIAALVCSIVGFTFASVWGFAFSKGGVNIIKEIARDRLNNDAFDEIGDEAADIFNDMDNDTTVNAPAQSSGEMQHMTDTLKALEGEEANTE